MTKYPINKFQQWLENNHNRTIESLTWQEYNKYHVMFNSELFYERMVKPYLDKEIT